MGNSASKKKATQSTPVQATPVQTTPVQATSVQATPVQANRAKANQAKANRAKENPVQANQAKENPVQANQAKENSVQSIPVQENLDQVKETSSNITNQQNTINKKVSLQITKTIRYNSNINLFTADVQNIKYTNDIINYLKDFFIGNINRNNYTLIKLLKIKNNVINFLVNNNNYDINSISELLYLIDIKVYLILKPLAEKWSIKYSDYFKKTNNNDSNLFKNLIDENYDNLLLCYIFDDDNFNKYNRNKNIKPYNLYHTKIKYKNAVYNRYYLLKNLQCYVKILMFIYKCITYYMRDNSNKFISGTKFVNKLLSNKIIKNQDDYDKGIEFIKKNIIGYCEKHEFSNTNDYKKVIAKIKMENKNFVLNTKQVTQGSNQITNQGSNQITNQGVSQGVTQGVAQEDNENNYKFLKTSNKDIEALKKQIKDIQRIQNIERNEDYKMLNFIRNQGKFFNTNLNNFDNYQSYILHLNNKLNKSRLPNVTFTHNVVSSLDKNVRRYLKENAKYNIERKNKRNKLDSSVSYHYTW